MRAQAWVSLFGLWSTGRSDRAPGVYAAAYVDYRGGSVLTYHELLVARLLRDGSTPRVRITDIWVDSEPSLAGGRSLWAIPKQLADLPSTTEDRGVAERTRFGAVAEGRELATGAFTAVPRAALVRFESFNSTSQEREDGSVVVTAFHGSTRALPCRARWRFEADGPLGFLHGRAPLASFRLTDVRLRFG